MLPQHGGVPNFRPKTPGPIKVLLVLILLVGLLLTLSLYMHMEPGDLAAENRVKLSLIITFLLTFVVFVAGASRWWYPHLRQHGNSQKKHRQRIHKTPSRRRRQR